MFGIFDIFKDSTPESHAIGEDFEQYLRDYIFSDKHYIIVEKTHSYEQNRDNYIESSKNPDIHFRDYDDNHFIVEAKFREDFYNGKITWCKANQLKRYKKIDKEKRIPVFLALGLDYPDDPDPLYVVPLRAIQRTTLTKGFLKKYKVNPQKSLSPKKLFKGKATPQKAFGSHSSVEIRMNAGLKGKGHCIRCGTSIKLNPMVPYCKKCYSSWKNYENEEYKEKHCHICGKNNRSMLIKPSCLPCYKKHSHKLEFP